MSNGGFLTHRRDRASRVREASAVYPVNTPRRAACAGRSALGLSLTVSRLVTTKSTA